MLHKLLKGLAPVAAIALSGALGGCNDIDISIDGEKGVPLAQLDMSGDPPDELVLAGPDKVIVTGGSALDIDVSGDSKAVDLVRFTLKDGTLGVMREKGSWNGAGQAVVKVTMPAPRSITIAGSGSVEAEGMADEADMIIAGSGSLNVRELKAKEADATIAGSGSLTAAGASDNLDLNLLGSGKAKMPDLKVGSADVTIAGSGDASFASDGKVEANIMGSGTVKVIGRATCEVSSMGSGKLVCETPAESEEVAAAGKAEVKGKKAAKKAAAKQKIAKKKNSPKKPRKA
ncbi:head GIN domain-containing protein [Altererythrobacter sp.]|uniref:head GIN domain-containing protein n=1 Tax=Altererythrobacter sp. TaxID=1872480 RepID=UPI003D0C5A77